MKRIVIMLLGLSACASNPAIKVQTVEVLKPVPVSCVKRADIPAEPAATGPHPPDARQAADLLGSKVLELRSWGHRQAALLQACVVD